MADMELVREYVDTGSEKAFQTLLNRHVNLVYAAAMRRVQDPNIAEEVTQTTFIILARKARSLGNEKVLSGWLYRTAQFAASRALRTEVRRRLREQTAFEMQNESSESAWEQLSPLLDKAMMGLAAGDRDALLLRYFENKSCRDVATTLGVNEATAQKRLVRAVEKLRSLCKRQGVVLPAVAITALLSANASQAAPISAIAATTAALKGAGISSSTTGLVNGTMKCLTWAKYKLAAYTLGSCTAAGIAVAIIGQPYWSQPKFENRSLGSWMGQLDDGHRDSRIELRWESWPGAVQRTPAQADAAKTFQAIGTNALPYLIASLDKQDSILTKKLKWGTPAAALHREAMLGLEALGPLCKPAIPELTRVLYGTNSPKEAAVALASIGPEGWEVLTRAIPTTNNFASACSIWALGSHRAAVPGTVDAMIANFSGPDVSAIPLTAWALAQIGEAPEQVIPLLEEGLKSPNYDNKWGCALALGQFGSKAAGAIPALKELLQSRETIVRHDAAQALYEIDPAIAINAGLTNAMASPHIPKTIVF